MAIPEIRWRYKYYCQAIVFLQCVDAEFIGTWLFDASIEGETLETHTFVKTMEEKGKAGRG